MAYQIVMVTHIAPTPVARTLVSAGLVTSEMAVNACVSILPAEV